MKDWLTKTKPKGKLREDKKLNVPNSPVPASQLPNRTQKNYIVPDVVDNAVRKSKPAPEPLPKTRITYLKSNVDSEKEKLKKKFKKGGEAPEIKIKPENKGKFTATKKATGKTTEELTHSKNPITKKRAIFALNAAKWKKGKK